MPGGRTLRNAVVVLLAAACYYVAADGSIKTPPPPKRPPSQAEVWASAVVDVLMDKKFYAPFPEAKASVRFSKIVPAVRLEDHSKLMGGGLLIGRNAASGVLFLSANVGKLVETSASFWRVGDVTIVMPDKDEQGQAVYPIVLRLLIERLPPLWHHKSEGTLNFWRRGTSKYMIQIDRSTFEERDFHEPGPGPWVVVIAGEESGDSEDP